MPRARLHPPESQLQSLDRGLAALELFTPAHPSMGLAEAACALNASKSTVHRLLSTLIARGYLTYDPRLREYQLGLAVVRLGNTALATLDLPRVAQSHLRRLAEATRESAFLLVVSGASAVVLDQVVSGQPLRLTIQPGLPWPLHAGASNKVLLAHLPPEEIAAYLSGPLQRVTDQTCAEAEHLQEELRRIRQAGFAWSAGELSPDVGAFAVPILDGEELVGGLAVAGPTGRLQGRTAVVADLQHAAREIARELGARACSRSK
jgi:IclR family transcriptional regulator, acetate operon repressor